MTVSLLVIPMAMVSNWYQTSMATYGFYEATTILSSLATAGAFNFTVGVEEGVAGDS